MGRVAYFDCFSGISGDMVLGALVDAGCDARELEKELRRVALSDWYLTSEKTLRNGLSATHVGVEYAETQHHRSLSDILALIGDAKLLVRVSERAAAIFRKLGEAEARVHGIPLEDVHFHEVGAV